MFRQAPTQADFREDPAFLAIKKHFNFDDVSDYAKDFGGMKSKKPLAVFTPPTVEVLQAFLLIANKHQIKMTIRGKGNSAYGQSQLKDGVIIDLKNIDASVKYNDDHTAITVPGFKTWQDLTDITKTINKTVRVTPDNLDLTVAGTISFATLGGTSYRCGSGADNVLSVEVLTLDGKLQECTPLKNILLYNAVLSGMGQFGIIINVTLPLIPAKKQAKIHFLSYDNPSDFLKQQKALYDASVFDHLKGLVRKTEGKWEYVVEAASFYDENEEQCVIDALAKLTPQKEETKTMPYFDFINMVTGFVTALRESGKLNAPHPWYNILMPENAIEEHLANVLDTDYLTGSDPIIIYPMNHDFFNRVLFVKPDKPLFKEPGACPFYLLGVLYNTSFEATANYPYRDVLQRNQALYKEAKAKGGCLYPVDATPLSEAEWREHYGSRWDSFSKLKKRFDPNGLLGSGLKIMPAEAKLTRKMGMQ